MSFFQFAKFFCFMLLLFLVSYSGLPVQCPNASDTLRWSVTAIRTPRNDQIILVYVRIGIQLFPLQTQTYFICISYVLIMLQNSSDKHLNEKGICFVYVYVCSYVGFMLSSNVIKMFCCFITF